MVQPSLLHNADHTKKSIDFFFCPAMQIQKDNSNPRERYRLRTTFQV